MGGHNEGVGGRFQTLLLRGDFGLKAVRVLCGSWVEGRSVFLNPPPCWIR